jgi:cytochrome P450
MTITLPSTLDDTTDFALDEVEDLHGHLAALRERAPAAWVNIFGRPGVMFTSYDLVNAAFKDEETFPSRAFYSSVVTDELGYNIQCMYGQEHCATARVAHVPAATRRIRHVVLESVANEPAASKPTGRLISSSSSRRAIRSRSSCACSASQAAEEDVTRGARC